MNRYKILNLIDEGTWGVVSLAVSETGDVVAVKKMKHKFRQWQECMELREVKALKRLSHPNIIKLREVIREGDDLFFVFEYCERNLFQLMKTQDRPYREDMIRLIMYQVFNGLQYLHGAGIFHRDLKPENLLCNGLEHIKIADFGLARDLDAVPPLTDYVSTRWYRAPEIMLKFPAYSWHVDVWAAGAVMAELYLQRPLFPGTSEADQLTKISQVLGPPPLDEWPELVTLLKHTQMPIPTGPVRVVELASWIPSASPAAMDLLKNLLCWDPAKRFSAREALRHPFFQGQ